MNQHYARLVDGVVVEVWISPAPEITPVEAFHPDMPGHWQACAADVEQGYVLEGAGLVPPPPPEPTDTELLAHAADLRWRREVGGLMLGGVPIATDDRSKIMIMGARVAAAANPDWETVWHGADGQTYPLNAAQMIAISVAVEAHVNGTFATFALVKAGIEAGEVTTMAAIDAAFD